MRPFSNDQAKRGIIMHDRPSTERKPRAIAIAAAESETAHRWRIMVAALLGAICLAIAIGLSGSGLL
jgi:hypothetical protein